MKTSRQIDLSRFSIEEVEAQWSDAQTLEKGMSQYARDLTGAMTELRIPRKEEEDEGEARDPNFSSEVDSNGWENTVSDFQVLYRRCRVLEQHTEMLDSSITALASMAGNRHALKTQQLSRATAEMSVREAKRARGLVLVGLVFFPLAYTASLFSMADPFRPGQSRFWMYFAVSLPIVVIFVLGYYLFDMGFSETNSEWRLANFGMRMRRWRSMKSIHGQEEWAQE